MKFNTIQNVNRYLDDIPRFQSSGEKAARFDLEQFNRFCTAAGNPYSDFPSIHIAGTNGKGSTCQILASVYMEAGYKVGLYTSPHLFDFKERFQVDSTRISDEEVLSFFRQHGDLIKSFRLTFFELCTALAFWWFRLCNVDLALIETGLGGRLDATNVITPELSIITNVSLDHTEILGETIPRIAKEKAGIIKRNRPVLIGDITGEARKEITDRAGLLNSPLYETASLGPEWEKGVCILKKEDKEIRIRTDLKHPVQAYNIALAWKAVEILQKHFPVPGHHLMSGLGNVRKNFKNPARFEQLHPRLNWYFDAAHNPAAVEAMVQMTETLKPAGEAILVLSIMKDKLNRQVAEEFQKFKKIYYYTLGFERAAGYGEVKKWLPNVSEVPQQEARHLHFLKELETELVIFAGSFYFYSTVRRWLQSFSFVQ